MEDSEFKKKYYNYKVRYVELKKIYEKIQNNELDINDYIEGIDDIEQIGGAGTQFTASNLNRLLFLEMDDPEISSKEISELTRIENDSSLIRNTAPYFQAQNNVRSIYTQQSIKMAVFQQMAMEFENISEHLQTKNKDDEITLNNFSNISKYIISKKQWDAFFVGLNKQSGLEFTVTGDVSTAALSPTFPLESNGLTFKFKNKNIKRRRKNAKEYLFGRAKQYQESTPIQSIGAFNNYDGSSHKPILYLLWWLQDFYRKEFDIVLQSLRTNLTAVALPAGQLYTLDSPNVNLGAVHFIVGLLAKQINTILNPISQLSKDSLCKSLYNNTNPSTLSTQLLIPTLSSIGTNTPLHLINTELVKTKNVDEKDSLILEMDSNLLTPKVNLVVKAGNSSNKQINFKELMMYLYYANFYKWDMALLTNKYSQTINTGKNNTLISKLPISVLEEPTKKSEVVNFLLELKTKIKDIGSNLATLTANSEAENLKNIMGLANGGNDIVNIAGTNVKLDFGENTLTLLDIKNYSSYPTDLDVVNFFEQYVFERFKNSEFKVNDSILMYKPYKLHEYMELVPDPSGTYNLQLLASQVLPESELLKPNGIFEQYEANINPVHFPFKYTPSITRLTNINTTLKGSSLIEIECFNTELWHLNNINIIAQRSELNAQILTFKYKKPLFDEVEKGRNGSKETKNITKPNASDYNGFHCKWTATLGSSVVGNDDTIGQNIKMDINADRSRLETALNLPHGLTASSASDDEFYSFVTIPAAIAKLYLEWAGNPVNATAIAGISDGAPIPRAEVTVKIDNIMDIGESKDTDLKYLARRQHPVSFKVKFLKKNVATPPPPPAHITYNPSYQVEVGSTKEISPNSITFGGTVSITGNPSGITIDSSNGKITVADTTVIGNYNIQITITNSPSVMTQNVQINVIAKAFVIYPNTSITMTQGDTTTVNPTSFSGSFTAITSSPLTSDITWNSTTGVITLKPTNVGAFTITVTITNNINPVTTTLTLTVNPRPASSSSIILASPPSYSDPIKTEFLDLPWGTAESDAIDELDDMNYKLLFKKYRMKYLKLKKKLSW